MKLAVASMVGARGYLFHRVRQAGWLCRPRPALSD